MSQVKVSVLMPVYNSKEYLEEAVQSVLHQDLKAFELLLIDDGSTDGSGEICDQLAETDPRIAVIHKPNGGMCHARNLALSQASGEYIAFVDNDDIMLPNFLSDNYTLAKEQHADCVRFGRWRETVGERGDIIHISKAAPSVRRFVDSSDFGLSYQSLRYGTEGVWSGLYGSRLINAYGIRFDESLRHGSEDQLFNSEIIRHARRICLNPGIYYVWRRRPSHSSSLTIAENNILGREHALYDEFRLMDDLEVWRSSPETFGTRISSVLVSTLRDQAYEMPTDAKHNSKDPIFKLLQRIYLPFFDLLSSLPLRTTPRLLLAALEKGEFWKLQLYVLSGRMLVNCRRPVHTLPYRQNWWEDDKSLGSSADGIHNA